MSQILVTGEAKIRDIQGPVVANSGVITALDGAASQYVRGDGTLADFPTSSGGGSSVSYYLNSSVSQGTIGGVAYRELNKEPIIGAGTDIAISANGYVASYLTDANDPDVLSIPGGNFNCEFYFSVNNNTGNPFFYAELYKYDGTTFTLLGSSVGVPEYINQGTIIAPYYFAIPVATAALALTDRLAIRIYVNVDGRTVTLHTENGHLCQVVTTLSKGMVSLNNLTDQSQFLAVGTSGTNFNIVSSGDTHTFNIPNAGVADRGLITNLAQTIGGAKTFSSVLRTDGGFLLKDSTLATVDGYTSIGGVVGSISIGYAISSTPYINDLEFAPATSNTYTFPNASGTLALTSNLSSYVPYTGATADVNLGVNFLIANAAKFDGSGSFGGHIALKQNGTAAAYTGYATLSSIGVNKLNIYYGEAAAYATELDNSLLTQSRLYKFPDLSGTLALLEGSQTFSGSKIFSNSAKFTSLVFVDRQINISKTPSLVAYTGGYITNYGTTSGIIYADGDTSNLSTLNFNFGGNYTYTFPAASGTLALTSNLSAYVPYSGATAAVNLGAFGLSASSISLTDSVYLQNNKSIWGTDFAGTTQYNLLSLNISNKVGIDAAGLGVVFGGTIGNGTYTYTLPSATGTLALTSNLSAYLPLAGGTLTGALNGTSATFGGLLTINVPTDNTTVGIFHAGGGTANRGLKISTFVSVNDNAGVRLDAQTTAGGATLALATAGVDRLTIGATGAATFSSSVTTGSTATNTAGLIVRGGSSIGTASASSGQILVGQTSTYRLSLAYDDNTGYAYIDNLYDNVNSNIYIRTRTNGTPVNALTILGGGNVGIGTTSPGAKLEVVGVNENVLKLRNGSGQPALVRFNDTSTTADPYVGSYGNDLAFGIYGVGESMRINSSRNVGIGTSTISSAAKLQVVGGLLAVEPTNGNTDIQILLGRGLSSLGTSAGSGITSKVNFAFEGSNDNFYQEIGFVTTTANQTRANSAADFYISTKAAGASSPSEKFRITSGGNVGIGTSSVDSSVSVDIQNRSASSNNVLLRVKNTSASEDVGFVINGINGGVEYDYKIGINTIANTSDLTFSTAQASGYRWYTSSAEVMRITSGGEVGIGVTPSSGNRFWVKGSDSTSGNTSIFVQNSSNTTLFFVRNDGVINTGSASGSPYNRTTGSFGNLFVDFDGSLYRGTASSQRFKENITDWSGSGLETILALKPKTFTYKEDYYSQPERQFLGLIAEEVAEVSPLLADFQNEDGTGQVENVRYANIVVPLIKAIQELTQKVNDQQQTINSLINR
jgi:hypothetical protein